MSQPSQTIATHRRYGEGTAGGMAVPTIEDVLNRVETGPWNWTIFLLGSLWGVFGAMQALATAFLSPAVDHWCQVPHLHNWTTQQLWNFSLPRTKVGGVPHHSQCEMYVRNYSLMEGVSWEERLLHLPEGELDESTLPTQPCETWEFDTSSFQSTLISEWELVCGREHLRSLSQSIFMVGYFFGAPLGGYFSDRFGRKRLMSGALWAFIVVSVLGSVAPSYPLFLVCRLVMAFTGTIVYQASYILAVEASSMRHRGLVGIMFSVPFALGNMLLPGVAYLVRDWRHLHLAISVPVILLISNTIILPESPRWLLQNGRGQEAERELQKAARWNSSKTFDSTWLLSALTQMKAQAEHSECSQENPVGGSSLRDMWSSLLVFVRTPALRKISLSLYFVWITCCTVYYGLSLSSANFNVDPFLYMFLGGVMELPSYTLTVPFVAHFGRKNVLIVLLVTCGITVLGAPFLPLARDGWGFLTVVMVSKFSITSAYQVVYLYSSELFPTTLRTRGVGVSSMVGRLGAIMSPFINDVLGSHHWAIPTTIFGGLSVVASFVICLLPETCGRALPNTVEDIENGAAATANMVVAVPEEEIQEAAEPKEDEAILSTSAL
ncbi:LOW QUALITY PROTEIN: organic cation transporter protein-like [Portunus trituberculatus]|uniref:LOW QUALITY PROTEIN: organic cation transporter protein-like n=1 Tax=Portunus trituberculatus TaxID=210409 RepID=UPI001E1CC8C9|nr:LOW QUALITY PROTEIN: organic cation transporter protein-like [Portunus trituberculatus]